VCLVARTCDRDLPEAFGCHCVRSGHEAAFDCEECRHICRDRLTEFGSLAQHVDETISLDELRIPAGLGSLERLPAMMPLRTHEAVRPLRRVVAAAVDLRNLERTIRNPSRMLRGVKPDATVLVAILSAADSVLENSWRKGPEARIAMFRRLRAVGFVACTGPTFSVYHESKPRLPCHNEISLRRHHVVLQEIADAGLVPIPNLYTTGRRGADLITEWLKQHVQVRLVSRDLTMNRQRRPFEAEFENLCDVLERVDRPMQVLLQGVSKGRAELVIRRLSPFGHSVTFVTCDPVLSGVKGRGFFTGANGSLTRRRDTSAKSVLIERNVGVFLSYFEALRSRADRHGRQRRPTNEPVGSVLAASAPTLSRAPKRRLHERRGR